MGRKQREYTYEEYKRAMELLKKVTVHIMYVEYLVARDEGINFILLETRHYTSTSEIGGEAVYRASIYDWSTSR